MNTPRFQNLVVLITGATSGIGRAAAMAFANEGARLVLVARNKARLEQVAEKCDALFPTLETRPPGPIALTYTADVGKSDTLPYAVSLAVRCFGRLDILINNAGIGHNLPLDQMSWEQVTRIFDTNVLGTLHGARAAIAQMKQQPPILIGGRELRGQIINIGSVVSFKGIPQLSIYCASKAAVRALTEALRFELQPDAIEVIGIYPGTTATEFFDRAYTDGRPWLIELRQTMSAERVAQIILHASVHHRREVVLSISGKLLVLGNRFFPRLTDWGTGLVYRAYRKRRASP